MIKSIFRKRWPALAGGVLLIGALLAAWRGYCQMGDLLFREGQIYGDVALWCALLIPPFLFALFFLNRKGGDECDSYIVCGVPAVVFFVYLFCFDVSFWISIYGEPGFHHIPWYISPLDVFGQAWQILFLTAWAGAPALSAILFRRGVRRLRGDRATV